MSRYLLAALIALAVAVALALTWLTLRPVPAGDGQAMARAEQDLAPFSRIELSGTADVAVRQGPAEHLSVERPIGAVRIDATVTGDTLHLSVRDTRRWWQSLAGTRRPAERNRLTITVRRLQSLAMAGNVNVALGALNTPRLGISAAGGSRLQVEGLNTASLQVDGSGALHAELSGTATEQHVSISGAGDYRAGSLASERASVSVSGVGKVVVRVRQRLDASISGAGRIDYYGNPQVRQDVSGVGRIRRRESDS
jgi:hypothetical protein